MREEISVGERKEKVLQLIEREKNGVLDYYTIKGQTEKMIIKTPTEFAATNWILLVEFKESKVLALKVRTENSDEIKPNNAPDDKS